MKTSQDPRHHQRIKLVKKLFTYGFLVEQKQDKTSGLDPILNNLQKIDQTIQDAAPEWSIEQINKIDLAILRLAVFELIIKKDQPFRVTVDEAVEIAKEFGSDSSPSFINGVLGKIVSSYKLDKE